MRVVWSEPALEDVDAAWGYYFYELGNPHAATKVVQAVLAASDALRIFPARGQRQPDGSYEFPVLSYPQYRLVYAIDAMRGRVDILHVETQLTAEPRPVAGS